MPESFCIHFLLRKIYRTVDRRFYYASREHASLLDNDYLRTVSYTQSFLAPQDPANKKAAPKRSGFSPCT